jgi:eukaryotic-like serine/threonine-protein kinase
MTPGTPDYMAPEATLGDEVDGRADLYALGCVGYFLLTGKQVFEAANALHAIARHLNDVPIPPSQREGIELPAELERLLLACLAKKPGDRPASASELSDGLVAIALAPWTQAEAAEWWAAREGSS